VGRDRCVGPSPLPIRARLFRRGLLAGRSRRHRGIAVRSGCAERLDADPDHSSRSGSPGRTERR
jgi:hypothetical protein